MSSSRRRAAPSGLSLPRGRIPQGTVLCSEPGGRQGRGGDGSPCRHSRQRQPREVLGSWLGSRRVTVPKPSGRPARTRCVSQFRRRESKIEGLRRLCSWGDPRERMSLLAPGVPATVGAPRPWPRSLCLRGHVPFSPCVPTCPLSFKDSGPIGLHLR